MSETQEQNVIQALEESTGRKVEVAQNMDEVLTANLRGAYATVDRLILELTQIDELRNREDKRNPQKVDAVIEGVKKLKTAIMYGVAYGIDNAVDIPEFKSKEEAIMAGAFAQLLDLRNVQLAINLKNKEEQTKGETNVTEEK